MKEHTQSLIRVGVLAVADQLSAEKELRRIPQSLFHWLHEKRPSSFEFLAAAGLPEVIAVMRALVLAEQKKISPFPGSVSLVIPAFFACYGRSEEELAIIADWIVKNHDNPYSPFNFRRTRAYWESARSTSLSPLLTMRRVRQLEAEEAHAKAARSKRHELREGIKRLEKGQSPESPELRESILKEMEREILEE